MRWPWRRRKRSCNGEAARKARKEAAEALSEAARRHTEIQREFNLFASQIEASMRRRHP